MSYKNSKMIDFLVKKCYSFVNEPKLQIKFQKNLILVMPFVQPPTLRDIAQAAGVSLATVSAALNDKNGVSPQTRTRILDIAASLGYEIKQKKRAEQESELRVIGLLVKHDLDMVRGANPFYSHVQFGANNYCQRHNISLMVASVDVDISNHPISWPTMINQNQIDGLIMAGAFIDDSVEIIKRKSDFPIVLVDSYSSTLDCDSVVTDNVGGAKKAVQYLVKNGHECIGLAGWNSFSPPSIQLRQQGYLQLLNAYGLKPFIVETELSRSGGQKAVAKLLANRHVTALFCCNDETAIGAINAFRELGLEVPRDVSVVGFDNIDLAAEISPALTTVHVQKSWMGALGVQALIERARNPDKPKTTVVLSTDLVIRESVSCVASQDTEKQRQAEQILEKTQHNILP